MIFSETGLGGCYLIKPEPLEDERGFFARVFDADEFRRRGLDGGVEQCSISYNSRAGTMRGLHYQAPPHTEAKLVRCLHGQVFDVVVDVRRDSPTYLQWRGFVLSAENRAAAHVPAGVAHGFLTLTQDAELLYQISSAHVPGAARGLRWDDPGLQIVWPADPVCMSARDREWPLLSEGGGG